MEEIKFCKTEKLEAKVEELVKNWKKLAIKYKADKLKRYNHQDTFDDLGKPW